MDYIGFYPHLRSLQVNYIAEEKKGACIIIKTYKKENQLYFEMINTDGKLILLSLIHIYSLKCTISELKELQSEPVSYTHLDVYKRQLLRQTRYLRF